VEARMAMMPESKRLICQGCWQQMRVPVPIRGPLALPMRVFGIRRSNMNPNICTICELMFGTVMRRRNVELDLTILFADLRGYTALSQEVGMEGVRDILDCFYDECAAAIWQEDGLLNKALGDGVMAVFNFPMARSDHARRAVQTGREIRRRCTAGFGPVAARLGLDPARLGVGVGIHTGLTAFGEFGRAHRDVTAIGNVVNLAARLQGAAAAWEIVVSREVLDESGADDASQVVRDCTLKGFAKPVTAFVM
jgi:adenylate cyclase